MYNKMHNKQVPLYLLFLLLSACGSSDSSNNSDSSHTNATEETIASRQADESYFLAEKINQYRAEQGLPPIPISNSMTAVAQAHVNDLENTPLIEGCNLHSWSDQGNWSHCCYTPDHAQVQCALDKPREISNNHYLDDGYEIVAQNDNTMTAEQALQQWKVSEEHNIAILNQGKWVDHHWQAMGVAISAHHAAVWFGEATDANDAL